MSIRFGSLPFVAAALLLASLAIPAWAVPYASAVRNTGGADYEFVLNESAQSVVVVLDGGAEVDLGALGAGRHSFNTGASSSYEIKVTNNVAKTWTELSDLSDPENNADQKHQFFFRPRGVAVNTDAASPYFGTVYVSHPIAIDLSILPDGRNMGDGIYSLTSDLIGVDLANNFAVTDPNDPTQAKVPTNVPAGQEWIVDQSGGSSPWMITLDDSNNLIVSDYASQTGGVKWASPDLTSGGLVLKHQAGGTPLENFVTVEVEPGVFVDQELHGAIMSKPLVSGSVGVDLTLWGIDEDLDFDLDTFNTNPDTGNVRDSAYHLWRWDVGSQTDYEQPPTLQVSATALSDVLDDSGVSYTDTFFDLTIAGIYHEAHYEEQFDNFYLLQNRTHGNESGIIIVDNDGADGENPTVLWSSKRWSFDNGLDGNNSLFVPETGPGYGAGIQDVFRSVGSVTITPDGNFMIVSRGDVFGSADFNEDSSVAADGDNPVMGADSNLPGRVLIVPLDENGIPDIEIDDNGTPGDTSDDFITNMQSFNVDEDTLFVRNQAIPISVDAAGNVYVADNQTERLQVFSPGGHTVATTTSGGLFTVMEVTDVLLPGDANGDGSVDILDLDILSGNFGTMGGATVATGDFNGDGNVDILDLDILSGNFGAMASASAAVPEPAGCLLLGVAALHMTNRRRRA